MLFAGTSARSQCEGGLSWDFDDEETKGFSVGKFFSETFTPRLVVDSRRIRDYVRDPRFRLLLERCGDLRAVDGIYLKALKLTEFNVGRALFLSLMATLEHRNVDFRIPVVGVLSMPLTFEQDSIFAARKKNLPSKIYADSPSTRDGDKDKLQHFFASAYLAYAAESPEFARQSGNFVEWGEAKFIVGGVDDPRDRRANKHGEAFGRDLLVVKTLLPSDYLQLAHEF
jgi:hypothetical protein